MDVLGIVIGSVVNAALLAVAARRLLGVAVGWPRTFVLSLVANGVAGSALVWSLERLDIDWRGGAPLDGSERMAVVLISTLFVAWVVALEIGVLTILEALIPTGSVPGPVEWLRTLPARWRRTRRYTQIVRIAARHGLGRYLTPRGGAGATPAASTALALRSALTQGGVTFVKLGQMLSTRPDLLGPEYVAELSRLHADVTPQPWPTVEATLRAELGRDPGEVFASVDQTPLAAASVGQVHLARLPSGEEVVVKVQRSDARAQVLADLDIVQRLAAWLQRTAPWARALGVQSLADGFAQSLEEELDYRVEAANATAVRAGLPAGSPVRIPAVHEGLSTARVLVMERLPGVPLSHPGADLAAVPAETREALAEQLLGEVMRQVMVTGVFHADLHAGNVLVAPGPDGWQLGLLDLGSVGRLDRGSRTSLGMLMVAIDRQDAVAASQALIDLLDAPTGLDDRALERDLGQLVMRFTTAPTQTSQLFVHLLRLVLRHGLSVPPAVAAAFRSLGALDGTLRLLHPELDLVAVAREHGREVVAGRLSPDGLRAELSDQLATLVPMAQRLPRRVSALVEDLHAGQFTMTVRTLQDPGERRFLTGLVQQVVLAILAATTAICGIVLTISDRGPSLAGELSLTVYLGLVLVLFAFVLGSRVLVLVFRSTWETSSARPPGR